MLHGAPPPPETLSQSQWAILAGARRQPGFGALREAGRGPDIHRSIPPRKQRRFLGQPPFLPAGAPLPPSPARSYARYPWRALTQQSPEIAVGERVYGYLPMATHLDVVPGRIGAGGCTARSDERRVGKEGVST